MENLSDIFAEEEARRLAEAKAEAAKEKAAWDALTPAEQAAIIEQRAARFEALEELAEQTTCDLCGDDLDEDGECPSCDAE